LTDYNGLLVDRGSSIRNVEAMCHQMFGSADNLGKYQNSVLLGITKAPIYVDDEPLTQNIVRELLTGCNSPIAQILANRIFLFDPLDRATDNLDFWHREQLHNVISQLRHIPQQHAKNLFQTTLTDGDKVHLLDTVRQLKPKIVNAITQGDVTALGQHWQLLQRLRVIEHPEVDQLVEGQVLPAITNAILQRADAVKSSANAHNFREATDKLFLIRQISDSLDGAPLVVNIDTLRRHLDHCREQYEECKRREEEIRRLKKEKEAIELAIRNRKKEPECSIL
jgi:hypothetical protein